MNGVVESVVTIFYAIALIMIARKAMGFTAKIMSGASVVGDIIGTGVSAAMTTGMMALGVASGGIGAAGLGGKLGAGLKAAGMSNTGIGKAMTAGADVGQGLRAALSSAKPTENQTPLPLPPAVPEETPGVAAAENAASQAVPQTTGASVRQPVAATVAGSPQVASKVSAGMPVPPSRTKGPMASRVERAEAVVAEANHSHRSVEAAKAQEAMAKMKPGDVEVWASTRGYQGANAPHKTPEQRSADSRDFISGLYSVDPLRSDQRAGKSDAFLDGHDRVFPPPVKSGDDEAIEAAESHGWARPDPAKNIPIPEQANAARQFLSDKQLVSSVLQQEAQPGRSGWQLPVNTASVESARQFLTQRKLPIPSGVDDDEALSIARRDSGFPVVANEAPDSTLARAREHASRRQVVQKAQQSGWTPPAWTGAVEAARNVVRSGDMAIEARVAVGAIPSNGIPTSVVPATTAEQTARLLTTADRSYVDAQPPPHEEMGTGGMSNASFSVPSREPGAGVRQIPDLNASFESARQFLVQRNLPLPPRLSDSEAISIATNDSTFPSVVDEEPSANISRVREHASRRQVVQRAQQEGWTPTITTQPIESISGAPSNGPRIDVEVVAPRSEGVSAPSGLPASNTELTARLLTTQDRGHEYGEDALAPVRPNPAVPKKSKSSLGGERSARAHDQAQKLWGDETAKRTASKATES